MTATRAAILVLILIAVAFFVGIGASLTRDDDDTAPTDRESTANVLDQAPGFLRWFLRMPGGAANIEFADLLDLSSPTIKVIPAIPIRSRVNPSESDEYRKARFRVADTSSPDAGVEIQYQADCIPEGTDPESGLNDQKTDLLVPASIPESDMCGSGDKACATLTVFRCGGEITFTCIGTGECELELRD